MADPALKARWDAILADAEKVLGGKQQASRWLGLPKVALGGKTPLEAMRSPEGCASVEKLLREVWD